MDWLQQMTTTTFESLAAFLPLMREFDFGSACRGVSNAAHKLVPSVGRFHRSQLAEGGLDDEMLYRREREAFDVFRTEHAIYTPELRTRFELLALAQHHGVPTRLLDWTFSPLIALWFASEPRSDERLESGPFTDGAVYVLPRADASLVPNLDVSNDPDPLDFPDVAKFVPSRAHGRIDAQKGLFTIHGTPWAAYDHPSLVKFIVPASLKKRLRHELFVLGIDSKTVFRDLLGLGAWIRRMKFEAGFMEPPPDA